MATPKTPWRVRLDELLVDGQWHDQEELIAGMVPVIPPGKAARHAIDYRARQRRKRGNPGPANPSFSRAADDQTVGARDIARHTINRTLQLGTIERRYTADHTLIRRRPQEGDL